MADDRGPGWAYYEMQKLVGEKREEFVTTLIATNQYKDSRPGAPDDNDMMLTQGDMLKQALQQGREAGTKMFFEKNQDQITQMINKGAAEATFWPEAPKATTDKLIKVEPPKQPSF